MAQSVRDRLAGAILFAAALVWTGLVLWTIPAGGVGAAGARFFPLWLGIGLAILSLVLFGQSFWGAPDDEATKEEAGPNEVFSVVATMLAIVLYGAFMEPLGFIPATALAVAAVMIFTLGIRRPLLIAGMSIGLSLGSYVVFGKLLGTYLPPGTWITIHL